jgi:AcrR family transcriptional regulator
VSEDAVPAELGRLWGLATTTSKLGRPAVLDVERVVLTAIELADRDGLAGVTLPKVAEVLGVSPMSLYRHVGSKAELLELMRDRAGGAPPRLDDSLGWRAGLRAWAVAHRDLFERHPWLAELPLSGPPSGPNSIAWMEACLHVLRETDLVWGAKLGVLNLLSGYVRSSSLTRQQLAEGRRDTGLDQVQAEQAYGQALARLVDPDRFPETASLFRSSVFEAPVDDDPDPDFTFGLELILDGIAAIHRRAGQDAGPDSSTASESRP